MNFILFGGNDLILNFALKLKERNYRYIILADKMHLNEKINQVGTLKDNFENHSMDFTECEKPTVELLNKYTNEYTIAVSISAPWIFKKNIIDLFKGNFFNLHCSDLPKNRGGAGYTWMILANLRKSGVSFHRLVEGIDTGGIMLQHLFEYPRECKIPIDFLQYREKKIDELFEDFLIKISKGESFNCYPQDESKSTYWPRINTDINGYINWSWDTESIALFINAFDDPYGGAMTFIGNEKVRLKKSSVIKDDGHFHPFQTGIIYRIYNNRLFIASNHHSLVIEEVFHENGNNILGELLVGNRFYTPTNYIDDAMKSRIIYTSQGLKVNK